MSTDEVLLDLVAVVDVFSDPWRGRGQEVHFPSAPQANGPNPHRGVERGDFRVLKGA
jgi:hypothetical protein